MLIVNLYGGIGNQLFQFCFAHALAEQNGQKVFANEVGFKARTDGHGEYLLDGIYFDGMQTQNVKSKVNGLMLRLLWKILRKTHHVNLENDNKEEFLERSKRGVVWTHHSDLLMDEWSDLVINTKNILVDGYFQWPQMLIPVIERMREGVSFKNQLNMNNKQYLKQINSTQAVCLHIRRGDYLLAPSLQVCNYTYYCQAIEWVKSKVESPVFYVFSDDINWVKENYDFKDNMVYITESNISSVELQLMSSCRHFIMSNSSFSWWAQALASNKEKYVVAPSPWYTDGRIVNLYLNSFHVISVQGGMDK